MDLQLLPRVFSRPMIEHLARGGALDELRRIARISGLSDELRAKVRLREVFEIAYRFLQRSHRAEYVYKNAIANKLLLGRHSMRSASLFTELTAGVSKADIVLVNGTSTVYEIKSEFDSTTRLESQVRSYGEMFDRIYVCSHASHVEKLEAVLPAHVGIIVLSSRYTLSEKRAATSNKANVKPATIFHSLRKAEYLGILKDKFGALPDAPPSRFTSACHVRFSTLSPHEAHDAMVHALRGRQAQPGIRAFVESVPASLRAAALYADLSAPRREQFLGRLDKFVRFA
jgi:hypothetical protein